MKKVKLLVVVFVCSFLLVSCKSQTGCLSLKTATQHVVELLKK